MTEAISRRDFVNGVLLTGAGLFLNGRAPDVSPSDAFNGYGGLGDYRRSNGNTWEVLSAGHAMRDGAFELDDGFELEFHVGLEDLFDILADA